jgi:hypothetical protein
MTELWMSCVSGLHTPMRLDREQAIITARQQRPQRAQLRKRRSQSTRPGMLLAPKMGR